MILEIGVQLNYQLPEPTDIIIQIQAPDFADQRVLSERFEVSATEYTWRISGEEGMGERVLLRTYGDFQCSYESRIQVDRPVLEIDALSAVEPHNLPSDAVRYLMPSRYCQSDELQNFVLAEFGQTTGGERISAIRDWIFANYQYAAGSSTAQTTAIDTFVQRCGVCRDFAHILIALARASSIPARFVSVYAPYVTPQDFHAVAEVYLDNTWHLVDATGMARADQIARIGVGLDAAQVPFLTSFGPATMMYQSVNVTTAG